MLLFLSSLAGTLGSTLKPKGNTHFSSYPLIILNICLLLKQSRYHLFCECLKLVRSTMFSSDLNIISTFTVLSGCQSSLSGDCGKTINSTKATALSRHSHSAHGDWEVAGESLQTAWHFRNYIYVSRFIPSSFFQQAWWSYRSTKLTVPEDKYFLKCLKLDRLHLFLFGIIVCKLKYSAIRVYKQ